MATVKLNLPPARRVYHCLLLLVLSLICLSLVGQIAKHLFGHTMLKGFVPMFYVDYESTAPTWYSSAALALAGALFATIAAAKHQLRDGYRWHWSALAILFFGLSADEIAMLHELPIDPMRDAFQLGGALYYGWVIPGLAFVGIVGIAFWRFLFNLPLRTRRLFVLSAVIFVSGAIGVEMLSGMQADLHGEENFTYALIVTIEEFLEMLGVVVLIRALLEYIEESFSTLHLQFTTQKNSATC